MVEANRAEHPHVTGREILEEIERKLQAPVKPEDALKAVMCTFSQHVSAGEARDVWTALPAELHPLLERCLLHRGEEAQRFDREEMIRRIATHLGVSRDLAESITSAVLTVISTHLPPGELRDVASQLPSDLRELWSLRPPPVEDHPMFRQVAKSVALPRDVTAPEAFSKVMCTLSRRLSLLEARRLVDGLPRLVQALVQDCLEGRPAEPAERFHLDGFLARVSSELHTENAEPVVRAVFRTVQQFIEPEEIARVATQLPNDLQALWNKP